jgi:2-desacetyl-2-hydroxyethyl bacteriochlorophyllide A dehydrogenase
MKVRAVVMDGPRQVAVRDLELPEEPPVGGAILKVRANGICGSDYGIYTGLLTDPLHATYPMVPGHEIMGEITAIDPIAEHNWGVKEGDRVSVEGFVFCGQCRECQMGDQMRCHNMMAYSKTKVTVEHGLWGGMAEYLVLVPGTRVIKLPDWVSDHDGGLVNPFSNAFYWGIDVGRIAAGQSLLILGAGQRGLALAAVANSIGIDQVIITGLSRDAHKLSLAKEFGATDVINVEETDTVSAVAELTGGRGVDVAIDSTPVAGGPISDAIRALKRGGRLVLAGSKGSPVDVDTDAICLKSLEVAGAAGRSNASSLRAVKMLSDAAYPFSKLHSHTFGLDDVEHAIQLLGGEIPDENPVHITIQP